MSIRNYRSNKPANIGRLIIKRGDVKKIDQRYEGKNKKELIIEKLLDFNSVTIKLIDPNKLLNPTMCKEKNMRSIEE